MKERFAFVLAIPIVVFCGHSCSNGARPVDEDAGTPDSGAETSMRGWNLAWAVRAGGDEHNETYPGTLGREAGMALSAASDGSVYVAGCVAETAIFGEGEANETEFPDDIGWNDGFLARYEPDGALSWVRRIGGTDLATGECATDVATLGDGSTVVVGRLDAPEVVLGEDEPNETVLTSSSPFNAFVARYTPDGELVWALQVPKSEESAMYGWNVHALPDGKILVSGSLWGIAWPDTETWIASVPSDNPSEDFDGFLAWFDEDGSVLDAVRIGNDAQSFLSQSVDVTESGDVIVAAVYQGEENFGIGEPNETVLHCESSIWCSSLSRYDAEGQLQWARDLGIFSPSGSLRIAIMADGNIGLVARFASPSDPDDDGVFFDPHSDGYQDAWGAVVATYRAEDGEFIWARMGKNNDGNGYPMGATVVAMPSGELVVGFPFDYELSFEGEDVGQRTLFSSGAMDIALMSLSAIGEIQWMHSTGGVGGDDFSVAGGQLEGASIWFTGQYSSDPFFATSGNDDEAALPLDGFSDVFLMRFDSTNPPTE